MLYYTNQKQYIYIYIVSDTNSNLTNLLGDSSVQGGLLLGRKSVEIKIMLETKIQVAQLDALRQLFTSTSTITSIAVKALMAVGAIH